MLGNEVLGRLEHVKAEEVSEEQQPVDKDMNCFDLLCYSDGASTVEDKEEPNSKAD